MRTNLDWRIKPADERDLETYFFSLWRLGVGCMPLLDAAYATPPLRMRGLCRLQCRNQPVELRGGRVDVGVMRSPRISGTRLLPAMDCVRIR